MKTQIFEYEGHVGAIMPENGKYLDDIRDPNQLGVVIDTKEVLITQKAKDILLNAKKDARSFAGLMFTRHGDGTSSIGITHKGKVYLGTQETIVIGMHCDQSVLHDCEINEFEAPEDFMRFIDDCYSCQEPAERSE